MMGVSRAGYYKWKNRGKPACEDKRRLVIEYVKKYIQPILLTATDGYVHISVSTIRCPSAKAMFIRRFGISGLSLKQSIRSEADQER